MLMIISNRRWMIIGRQWICSSWRRPRRIITNTQCLLNSFSWYITISSWMSIFLENFAFENWIKNKKLAKYSTKKNLLNKSVYPFFFCYAFPIIKWLTNFFRFFSIFSSFEFFKITAKKSFQLAPFSFVFLEISFNFHVSMFSFHFFENFKKNKKQS